MCWNDQCNDKNVKKIKDLKKKVKEKERSQDCAWKLVIHFMSMHEFIHLQSIMYCKDQKEYFWVVQADF